MKQNKKTSQVLCFGEVLWDMLPGGKQIGGAPLNVAYHLSKLGIRALIISRIGTDEDGQEIQRFIKNSGIVNSLLQEDSVHPTSRVEVSIGPREEATYDIIRGVAWDFIEYNEPVKDISVNAEYIVFGSLVMRNKTSADTLLQLLREIPVKIFDVNLRPPFYSKEIVQRLLMATDIVKMNVDELKIISGWSHGKPGIKENMELLQNEFGIKVVIVTCGSEGAHVKDDNSYFFKGGYKVSVIDTVGSGDAFLAAFLSQYIRGGQLKSSLDAANKMGAFIVQKKGGCPGYTLEEVNTLINQSCSHF